MIVYLDTSALIKLTIVEPESSALQQWLGGRDSILATSVIGDVEMCRTALRKGGPGGLDAYTRVQSLLTVLPLTAGVVDTAKRLPPQAMRSLDAIHVATALALGPDCDVVVGYDSRMIDAARAAGLTTASPGAADTTP